MDFDTTAWTWMLLPPHTWNKVWPWPLTSKILPGHQQGQVIFHVSFIVILWHYALTKSHTLQLEAIQKRAIQIVLNFSRGMPYSSMLFAADLDSLASHREDISRKFFHNITQSTSCLHHLLPDPKLSSHNARLRSYEKFPRLHTRTKRYCSFVQYALSHYQDRIYNS